MKKVMSVVLCSLMCLGSVSFAQAQAVKLTKKEMKQLQQIQADLEKALEENNQKLEEFLKKDAQEQKEKFWAEYVAELKKFFIQAHPAILNQEKLYKQLDEALQSYYIAKCAIQDTPMEEGMKISKALDKLLAIALDGIAAQLN